MLLKHTRHVFEGRFTPLRLVVNGRKGRRVVVVLGSDRKHYRVLDLDFSEKTKGGREGGEGGESSKEDSDVEMGEA
jgi:anaphase-promoting complex subunit 4